MALSVVTFSTPTPVSRCSNITTGGNGLLLARLLSSTCNHFLTGFSLVAPYPASQFMLFCGEKRVRQRFPMDLPSSVSDRTVPGMRRTVLFTLLPTRAPLKDSRWEIRSKGNKFTRGRTVFIYVEYRLEIEKQLCQIKIFELNFISKQ